MMVQGGKGMTRGETFTTAPNKKILYTLILILVTLMLMAKLLNTESNAQIINDYEIDELEKSVIYEITDIIFNSEIELHDAEYENYYYIVSYTNTYGDRVFSLLESKNKVECDSELVYVTFSELPKDSKLMTNFAIRLDELASYEDYYECIPYMMNLVYEQNADIRIVNNAVKKQNFLHKIKSYSLQEKIIFIGSSFIIVCAIVLTIVQRKKNKNINEAQNQEYRNNIFTEKINIYVQMKDGEYNTGGLHIIKHPREYAANIIFICLITQVINIIGNKDYKSAFIILAISTFIMIIVNLYFFWSNRTKYKTMEYEIEINEGIVSKKTASGINRYSINSIRLLEEKDYYHMFCNTAHIAVIPKKCIKISKEAFGAGFKIADIDIFSSLRRQIRLLKIEAGILYACALIFYGIALYSCFADTVKEPGCLWENAEIELEPDRYYYIDELYPCSYLYGDEYCNCVALFYGYDDVIQIANVHLDYDVEFLNEIEDYFEDENLFLGDYNFDGYVKLNNTSEKSYFTKEYLQDLSMFKDKLKEGNYNSFLQELEFVTNDEDEMKKIIAADSRMLDYKRGYFTIISCIFIGYGIRAHVIVNKKKRKEQEQNQEWEWCMDETDEAAENHASPIIENIEERKTELLSYKIALNEKEVKKAKIFHLKRRNAGIWFLNFILPVIFSFGMTFGIIFNAMATQDNMDKFTIIACIFLWLMTSAVILAIIKTIMWLGSMIQQAIGVKLKYTEYGLELYDDRIIESTGDTITEYVNKRMSKLKADKMNYYLFVNRNKYLIIPKRYMTYEDLKVLMNY